MQKYCPQCFSKYPTEVERCPQDGSALVGVSDRDLTGEILDERYEILSKLGQGGMGVVYRATQRYVKRAVALKVLRRSVAHDESSLKRFMVEAQAIASLRNQHTITLHDFGVTGDGLLYFTMDLIEGVALSKLIRSDGAIPWRRATDLLLQACDSLADAHNQGILHRDLKPDNMMVSLDEGKDFVTVLDFGIAKVLNDDSVDKLTATGMICGTPAYLSPEQASGQEVGPPSDIYALGIILYEMLTGQPPFMDKTAISILMKHINEEAPPVHEVRPDLDIPPELNTLLSKTLAKRPSSRFGTIAEFRAALLEAIDLAESGTAQTIFPELPEANITQTMVEPQPECPEPSVPQIPDPSPESHQAGETVGTVESLPPEVRSGDPRFPLWKVLVLGGGLAALLLVLLVWQPWMGGKTETTGKNRHREVPREVAASGSLSHHEKMSAGTAQPNADKSAIGNDQGSKADGSRSHGFPTPDIRVQDLVESTVSNAPIQGIDPAITLESDAGKVPDSKPDEPEVTESPATTVSPLQVIVDTDPRGGKIRWKDETGNGRAGPLLLVVTLDDDGREIVCTRPGYSERTVALSHTDLQEDPRLIVHLVRKKSINRRLEAPVVPGKNSKATGAETAGKEDKPPKRAAENKNQEKKETKGWGTVEIP